MSKDMPLSLRPEVLQGYNERMNDSTFLQEGSCPLQRLQFIGKWLFFFFFCICASNEPCQYSSAQVTLSATVFDRLHCKESACNSLFVPAHILDHLLVTLLF